MKIIEYESEFKNKTSKLIYTVIFEELNEKFNKIEFLEENYDIYRQNGGIMYIAINDLDEVIGTLALKKVKESYTYEIKRVYVRKDCRRLGIARLLMDKAFIFLKENNTQKAYLTTYKNYISARRFYKNYGFKYVEHEKENVALYEMVFK